MPHPLQLSPFLISLSQSQFLPPASGAHLSQYISPRVLAPGVALGVPNQNRWQM